MARLAAEHGQSAVEFALVLPLIVILALALFGGGKVLFYWNNATQVANEGARLVSVNAGPTFPGGLSFKDYLKKQTLTLGGDSAAAVAVEFTPVDVLPAKSAGSAATVWICRTYGIPFFGDLTIRSKATMRLERNVTLSVANDAGCPS